VLGRAWSGPAELLTHLDSWGTAATAGLAAVLVNNLPAASLLAARTPEHPFALIVGLNLGPDLCVTGSLAWLLWLRASLLGAVAVPASVVVALGALAAR
jgi:arsenical pump membrane protein